MTVVEPPVHTRGGIVVLQETHHLTEPMRRLLSQLACEGWLVAVPNLFHRPGSDPDDKGVYGDDLFEDVDGCLDWFTQRGVQRDCIGAFGFDKAGTAAFLVAATRPVAAAVSVAARGITEPFTSTAPALIDAAPGLRAPWLGLFGVGGPAIPTAQLDRLDQAVAAAHVPTNIVRYARPRRPIDLVDAQTRVFDWYDSFLR